MTAVAVCVLSAARVVAAMRNGSGNLELISWGVDANGNLQQWGTGEAGGKWAVVATAVAESIRSVAISGLDQQHVDHVVTPVSNAQGELEVIEWLVGP